jgi:gliding motility-associated-like protein
MSLIKIPKTILFIFFVIAFSDRINAQQFKKALTSNYNFQANGCGITVNAGPDITICAGIGKALNGNVTNSTDYIWDPPDGLSNPKILKPVATPSMTTTYTLTAKAMSGNLINNGDFETGGMAPATTDYTLYSNINNFVTSTGGYMVLSIPQIAMQFGCNPNTGNFTLAITPTGSSSNIWCRTIAVNPNTDYKIDYKVFGIPYIFGSPPTIGMRVNGTLIGSIDAPSGLCTEADAAFIWNSGAATSATFCLANYGGTGMFSICMIDDIKIRECCVEKDQVTVTVYELKAEALPPIDINCLNRPITIDGSPSTQGPGITYNWSTKNGHIVSGDKTLMPVVDTPGTYTLKIIGLYGCEATTDVIVNGSVTKPDVTPKSTDIDCLNPTGSIDASSKSSSPQFEWNGPNGFYSTKAKNLNLKEPGEYIVKVTDTYGCESTAKIEVKDNRTDLEAEITGDSITCAKDSAILKANSIARKPIYKWSGPFAFKKDSSDIAIVRDTGWYYINTTDSSGCKELDSFYVKDLQNAIPISIQADTIKCSTPDVVLKLTSDTTATIQWKGPNGFVSNQYQPKVSEGGWYYVDVKTKDGCKGSDSVFVEKELGVPDIFISTNDTITCDKKSIQVSGGSNSTGATIEWLTPTGIIKNQSMFQAVDSGMYVLTVTGLNGCKISKSIQLFKDVTSPNLFGYKDTLDCLKDTLNLQSGISNARAYLWTGPNNYSSNSSAPQVFNKGAYTLTVTASNGCTSSTVFEIEENKTHPNLQIKADTISCLQSSITPNVITDSTIVSFHWTGPNGFNSLMKSPTITKGGNYFLTVTGINGCDSTQFINITEDLQKPSATLEADTIQCKTTANIRAINISPGVNIQWRGPKGFTSNLPSSTISDSGYYVLTLTGTNGCIFQDSIFVFQKDQLPDIFAFDDTITCIKKSIQLNGGSNTQGVSIDWKGPNGFNSNLAHPIVTDSGIYTLKVTNSDGCESIRNIRIYKNDEPLSIKLENLEGPFIDCRGGNGQTLEVFFTGNIISFVFYREGQKKGPPTLNNSISVGTAGKWFVEALNENGCLSIDSVLVEDLRKFPQIHVRDDSINCLRNTISLPLDSADTGLIFNWTGPNNFISNLKNPIIQFGGNFIVTAIDTTNLCQITKSVFIKSDTTKPDLSLSADTLSCKRPSAPVKAGSSLQGFTMKWTGPNGFSYTLPQFATNIPGRYFCTITNPRSGCSTTSFVDVIEDTSRIKDVVSQLKNASCNKNNGKIFITQVDGGKKPYRFSIDNGITFVSDLSTLDLAPGNYSVLVEDQNGCSFTLNVKIDEEKSVNINLPNLIQLKSGEKNQLHLDILADTASIVSINWSPSDQLSCNDCPDPILTANHDDRIYVSVVDINGCVDTASILLQIQKESNYFFPNTFSPNGDNINDFFYPVGINGSAKVSYLNIYDRWGNLVYQRKDFQPGVEREGWDGKSKDGQKVNPGVYIYVAEIIDQGIMLKYSGDVTLIQ